MRVLVLDVGGTHVKASIANSTESVEFESGPSLTPHELVERVEVHTAGWSYDVIAFGYPGQVSNGRAVAEPGNLSPGWVGFDFEEAFGKPVRLVNDAALQALGAYQGGRMLFLGLGTGLGSVVVSERVVVPLELGELSDGVGGTLGDRLGSKGFDALGRTAWGTAVADATVVLRRALLADYVTLGGGRAELIDPLPPDTRRGGNDDAIAGGTRLWSETVEPHDRSPAECWRVVG